jgi:RNA polymerase sigma factor (sigma-70 family)
MSSMPERSVVAMASLGDDDAFQELVRRHQAVIRNLLRRLSGNRAVADDLAQDAFLQAWLTIGKLRSPAAFGGWLRKIAINNWLRYVRRTRPVIELSETTESEGHVASHAGIQDILDRVDLDRGLAHLKPPERLRVVLLYEEGMTHGDIAAATSWPLGTVKSHVARGVARLRARLIARR